MSTPRTETIFLARTARRWLGREVQREADGAAFGFDRTPTRGTLADRWSMRIVRLGRRSRPKDGTRGSEPADDSGRGARPRRELVGWIALGLLVAVVLTVLSRSSVVSGTTHPKRQTTSDKAAQHNSSSRETTTDPRAATSASPARSSSTASLKTVKAATTTTTPSTTSTTTSTTTTTVARATGPTSLAGTLAYPSDLATTYPFTSPSGLAAVRVRWGGGSELDARLHCPGATTSAPGAHGISLSVTGRAGRCSITVSLASGTRTSVSYLIEVDAPSSGSP